MNRMIVVLLMVTDHAEKAEEVIKNTVDSSADKMFVITGPHAEMVKVPEHAKNAEVVFNNDWKEGKSSFIKCGIKKATEAEPGTDAIILITSEQGEVNATVINELIETHLKRGKPIVTSLYPDNTQDPPALFHQSMFPELLQLMGDNGPKDIISIHEGNTIAIPFKPNEQ